MNMDNCLPCIALIHCLSVFGSCESRGLENIDSSLEYRTATCPESYEYFQQSCYKLYTDRVDRYAASSICIGGNSHLVDIKSQAEQDFVANLLEEDPDIKWRQQNTNPKNVGAWIGLKVSSITGEFVWSDGTPLEFTAWDPINGRDEPETECVRMDSRFNFQWGDRNCFHHFDFVCERDSDIKMSTLPNVMPYGTTVSAPTVGNHGNNTGHDLNKHDEGVFAIEVAYPFLTIIVAVVVGLVVYWIYLRKRARSSVTIQPSTPENTHRNSFSLQNHGYVEINDHPQSPTHKPLCSNFPPKPPPKLGDVNVADVRISLQSNGYIEFKSKHDGKGNTSHLTGISNDITHTYFNPNKHEFHSASSIKHTYFKPGTQENKP